MATLRITKKYNNLSPLNGIVMIEKVELGEKSDKAMAAFVGSVNALAAKGQIDHSIIDYEWAVIDKAQGVEVLENPTGGRTGKL